MNMFGLLVSGRLVDTSFREVDPTHALIDIVNVDSFNHVVVFLTGTQPFPDGMGGAVYFSWPEPAATAVSWQFLGGITNAKPSAIFKIAKLKVAQQRQTNELAIRFGGCGVASTSSSVLPAVSEHAQLGIAMEPLVQLEGMTPDTQTEASAVPAFVEFSQKMVESLFNYTSSFAVSHADMRAKPSENFVPFSAMQQWYANFERRLQQNPYFWRT